MHQGKYIQHPYKKISNIMQVVFNSCSLREINMKTKTMDLVKYMLRKISRNIKIKLCILSEYMGYWNAYLSFDWSAH